MRPTLAVIIPTVGRESVLRARESCVGADQVIVSENTLGGFGHPARNYELDAGHVATDYVVSIDDDDAFLPGALAAVRTVIADTLRFASDGVPWFVPWFVFRMTFGPGSHANGTTIWHRRELKPGNVGTPMMVWPASARARWGTGPLRAGLYGDLWPDIGDGYFGDYEMAAGLEAELGPPVWREEVIAIVRPAAIQPVL